MVKIRVIGEPQPQGSKSAFAVRKKGGGYTGRVVVTEDNPRVKSWRQAVIDEIRAWRQGTLELPEGDFGTLPVEVMVTFVLSRPTGHYGTGRNAGTLVRSAPTYPGRRPDLDKLARSTLDAMTDCRVWADDGQVVRLRLAKVWAAPGEQPGAVIEVVTCDG